MDRETESSPAARFRNVVVALAVAALVLPVLAMVAGWAFAKEDAGNRPFVERPAGHDACVRDTTYMRFHHWALLKEMRDHAVRGGERGDLSLNRCRECHPNRDRFCNRCHESVSLHPDCFTCHYYPESETTARGR